MLDDASVRWPLYVYAVCFGLGYGARGPIISAIAADRFPGRSFATIFGFISIGHGLGGALGPWYGGALYDRLESYTLAFVLACVSLCGGDRLLLGGNAAGGWAFVMTASHELGRIRNGAGAVRRLPCHLVHGVAGGRHVMGGEVGGGVQGAGEVGVDVAAPVDVHV